MEDVSASFDGQMDTLFFYLGLEEDLRGKFDRNQHNTHANLGVVSKEQI
jgi:hypothetical protein